MSDSTRTLEFSIEGMSCAACARRLETGLQATEGVAEAVVNFATEAATLRYDPDRTGPENLAHAVTRIGFRVRPVEEASLEAMEEAAARSLSRLRWKLAVCSPLAAAIMVFSMVPIPGLPASAYRGVLLALATLAVMAWGGKEIFLGAWSALRHRQSNMNTLISLGTSAAFLYSAVLVWLDLGAHHSAGETHFYFDSASMIIVLVLLGRWLEARARGQTGLAVRQLMKLQPSEATVLRDGQEVRQEVTRLMPGDRIRVRPGEQVPADGIIEEGLSALHEAMITGEPLPKDKGPGDTVIAGTINGSGSFIFRAQRVGRATALAGMIRLVREAQGTKVPIQLLADRIAGRFVPAVLLTALATLLAGWWLGPSFSFALINAVSVLVIACPCAMGLATPTAIVAGMGRGASAGILIRNGTALQKAEKADVILLDKTGTLSQGRPQVVGISVSAPWSEPEVLSFLEAAEQGSEHPLSRAILEYARGKELARKKAQAFTALGGLGVRARVDGREVLAGSRRLLEENGVLAGPETSGENPCPTPGATLVYAAIDGSLAARICIADPLKKEAAEAVASLTRLRLEIVLMSGDQEGAAREAASALGIRKVIAGILPEGKAKEVQRLQAEGRCVAMVGDGINDAPALSRADLGIAMGTGADVAVHAADITLVGGDIRGIARALHLSRKTMRIIRQNLFWAFLYNIVCIPLAAGAFYPLNGWLLNPMWASAAMAFSSVSVVTNSLRLKRIDLR